jgi:hypothetical protein
MAYGQGGSTPLWTQSLVDDEPLDEEESLDEAEEPESLL